MIPRRNGARLAPVATLKTRKLTPTQRRWIENVLKGDSDIQAYKKAYRCKPATAEANAHRLRRHEGVMMVLIAAEMRMNQLWLHALAPASKKGKLVRIMMEGKDSDAIRAIKELNVMEERERALGGGEGTEFDEMIMMVARRRRRLPFQDQDDKDVIELEDLPK